MSLELIKESVRVSQVIGEDTVQAIFENDIIVPDVKPDVSRILLLDGDACINSTETLADRVSVTGNLNYKILYISDDSSQRIKSINTSVGFSQSLDIPNTRSGMAGRVKCEIEHVDFELVNSRKINVKTIAKFGGKVFNESEQALVNDLRNMEDIQILKENIRVNSYVGSNTENYMIREALEVPAGKPAIREILRSDIKISSKEYRITDNKVMAKGELNVSTLYLGDMDEDSIQYMEHEVPFTQFLELNGVGENSTCDLDFRVEEASFEPDEDSDGEMRVMNAEIGLSISAAGFNNESLEVVADAYSPKARLDIEKDAFNLQEIVAENRSQIILKDTIVLEEGSPEISEVFNILCKPVLSEVRILDDRVQVEGVVANNVLYLATNPEQPVFCFNQEIPFRHGVDIKGIKPAMNCDANLDIEHCSYSMVSANEVEIRLVIGLNMKVLHQTVTPLIVRVEEVPGEDTRMEGMPSIVLYFAKTGDTLWKVAKEHYTTMDYIQGVNNLTPHAALTVGQQILIPKKYSV